MDNTLYVGLSRQMTLRRQLDIAANNMANVDTAGFKVEKLMLQTDPLSPSGVGAGSLLGPVKYVIDDGVARDFGQGGLERTGSTYDVAVEGDGFFTVQTAAGPRYTRDGRFTVDSQNRLVTKAGDPVVDASGSGVTLDPQSSPPSIGKDGAVTQTDIHGQVNKVGKLGAVRFANLSGRKKEGYNLDSSPETPGAANDANIRQGMVERSNVSPMLEITSLIDITRAYERITQMMASNQDLSKSAVERLGRAA
ncbi:flagellar basal-body rod protein FlgF [soil metagenome]